MKRKITYLVPPLCLMLVLTGCATQRNDEMASLQKQIETMEQFIAVNLNTDLTQWDGDYIRYDKLAAYPLYDDTAVIEAYKTGDSSALSEKDAFILSTATDVIKSIETKDGMSDYEKEKAAYTHLVSRRVNSADRTAWPGGEDDHNPYGVFYHSTDTALGYATAFKLLMGMMEIECKVIRANDNYNIAWNMVQLDGEWYHVDVHLEFYGVTEPTYVYFNVPDEVMRQSYSWEFDAYPKAASTKYCLAYIESLKLENVYELPKTVKKAVDDGKTVLYLQFTDGSALDYSMLSHISPYFTDHYLYQMMNYEVENEPPVYCIKIEKYENSTTPEMPTYNWDMMQEELDRVFAGEAMG